MPLENGLEKLKGIDFQNLCRKSHCRASERTEFKNRPASLGIVCLLAWPEIGERLSFILRPFQSAAGKNQTKAM